MSPLASRRQFLQTAAVGSGLTLGADWGFLTTLPRVNADEAKLDRRLVAVGDELEPLTRLVEDTPRSRLLEEVAARIRNGSASYRQVLGALFLAGVRNVQPRPAVGFKFHSVLVVNSCHLASLSGPDAERWLPLFWALDYFKSAQAEESQKSGWRMTAVDESKVPSAADARQAFITAMDRWDVEQADVATAGIVRTLPASEVFELFAQYAARDFRSIGHKAIYLANAWRTLQVIGWEFAEPVMRSLTFAMLNHVDEPNPSSSDLDPDRPWRQNLSVIDKIPAGWLHGKVEEATAKEFITLARTASASDAATAAVQTLGSGADAVAIWDGNFVAAGELLMRQPGIVSLHGLTTANALHYLWQNVGDEALRKRLLLQACSFTALFRQAAERRGALKPTTIADVANHAVTTDVSLDAVFADVSRDGLSAARKLQGYLQAGGNPQEVIDTARRLVFFKGRDAHDYKFSSAVLEDWNHLSPHWRPLFLALSVFNLKGTGHNDSALVARTRAALSG
ncbi:MAG TPA: hypothetical protein VFG20_04830 [Planctomycetaceae bacterium]|nr:hypothetical protein [Planctomycetaceae bacterium]